MKQKNCKKYGLPNIQGSEGGVKSVEEAKSYVRKSGIQCLSAAGGGGEGMKIVKEKKYLNELFLTAKNEAKKYFENDELYIEKYFMHPRHIEVQIMSGKIKLFI